MVDKVEEVVEEAVVEETKAEVVEEKTIEEKFYGKEEDEKAQDSESPSVEEVEEKSDPDQEGEQEETAVDKKQELEITLSKDSPLDQGYVDAIKEYAKDNDLSNEAAQEILTHKEDAVLDYLEDQDAKRISLADEGLKGMKAKYGDEFTEAQELALKPFKDPRFIGEDGDALHKVLVEERLIDNEVVFEWAKRVGMAMSDDKYVSGNTPAKKATTREERFYGKQAAK